LRRDFVLRVPFGTLVKVALFLLLVVVVIKLVPLLAILYIAAMVAVVLIAAADWLEQHGVRRTIGLIFAALTMFVCVFLFLFVVVPTMVSELRQLVGDIPKITQRLDRELPAVSPYIRTITAQ